MTPKIDTTQQAEMVRAGAPLLYQAPSQEQAEASLHQMVMKVLAPSLGPSIVSNSFKVRVTEWEALPQNRVAGVYHKGEDVPVCQILSATITADSV